MSQLIELQELDLEIQRVTDRLATIPVERDQRENEFKKYAAEFLDLKSKYEETLAERRQLESDLATTQQNHEKYKQDLMRVRNEKEYATALREIDATKKQVGQLESEILKRMEEVERLEALVTVAAPDVEKKRTEVDQLLAELEQESQQAAQQLEDHRKRREAISIQIPKSLFATYDRMARMRRGQALSEIRQGICTACRMKVRPKVFSDVRKGDEMVTCENCGRILFYRPEPTGTAEAAATQPGVNEA